jgi:hypothetical protein
MSFVLGLSPENVVALKGLAYSSLSLGREPEARTLLEKVLELEPADTWSREVLSDLD